MDMIDETYMLNYYRKLGINLYMMYVFIYIDWHGTGKHDTRQKYDIPTNKTYM